MKHIYIYVLLLSISIGGNALNLNLSGIDSITTKGKLNCYLNKLHNINNHSFTRHLAIENRFDSIYKTVQSRQSIPLISKPLIPAANKVNRVIPYNQDQLKYIKQQALLQLSHQKNIQKVNAQTQDTISEKQKLDSTVYEKYDTLNEQWTHVSKYEYAYDQYENQTLLANYLWNSNSLKWDLINKFDWTYNENGVIIFYRFSSMNNLLNHAVTPTKDEFTYNSNGFLINNTTYTRDTTSNQWIKSTMLEISYDTKWNKLSELSSVWDVIGNQWAGNQKDETTYDTKNQILFYSLYTLTNGVWAGSSGYEYRYDANGNIIYNADFSWNPATNLWKNNYKSEYKFNDNGNEIESISSNWDQLEMVWIADFKNEHDYDAQYNLILESNYLWDAGLKQWVGQAKTEFTFDKIGKEFYEISYNWNSSNVQWQDAGKIEYVYDSIGTLTLKNYYSLNSVTGLWDLGYKTTFDYDASVNKTTETSFDLLNGQWFNDSKTEYVIDKFNNKTLNAIYVWDDSYSLNWVGQQKEEFAYNDDNLKLSDASYQGWNYITSSWVGSNKTGYEYDNAGNLTVVHNFDFNITKNQWEENYKTEYAYDQEKNQTTVNNLLWDTSENKWNDFAKNEILFDISVPNTLLISPLHFENKALVENDYSIIDNKLTKTNINMYYWSSNAKIKNRQLKVQLFPNPVKESFSVVGSSGSFTVQCFDQQGRLMLSKNVTSFEKIPANELLPGLYIVKLISQGGTGEVKLLKQ